MLVANRLGVFIFSALLLLATAASAYFSEPYILFIPVAALLTFVLVQQPRYLLYLLIISIPWSIEYKFPNGFGTDLPDEPLMLLLALASVIIIVSRRSLSKWPPLLVLIVLEFLWMVFTVITSTHIGFSIKYFLAKSWYLLAFVVAPVYLFKKVQTVKVSAILLLASMSIAVIVSLVRHSTYGFSFAEVNTALDPFFRNHVNYGALLVVMIPIAFALKRFVAKRKYLVNGLLLLLVAAVYLSYSRGAWLALLVGALSYWLLMKKKLVLVFGSLIVLCIAFVLFMNSSDRYIKYAPDYRTTIFHKNFNEHLIATYRLKDVSTEERFYRWIAGVRMIENKWETGYGPTTFYENYKSYAIPIFKTWVSDNKEHSTVHNYFLLLLIEQGIPGLCLFLLLFALAFRYAENIYHSTSDPSWKTIIAAVAVMLSMICTVNFLSDLIETDKIGSVFYLCIAVLIVADRNTRKSSLNSAPDIEGVS
jgi:O-antigen ligase